MVEPEWPVVNKSQDGYTRELYVPKIDVAVGPFNIDGLVQQNNNMIDDMVIRQSQFLNSLVACSANHRDAEIFLSNRNKNPRCFMAIEVEGSGSSKHRLGDFANTSIIGAIGIVIPMIAKVRRSFVRISKYVGYATEVGKLNPAFKNVLVVDKDDFQRLISEVRIPRRSDTQ